MSRIIDFYRGVSTDSQGRRLADILAWPDDTFEEVHDFIQWLFPLPEPSAHNADAPRLTDDDVAEFWKSFELRDRLKNAFDRFLSSLGLTRAGEQVVEADGFDDRIADVWSVPNHNWLRITRVLRCLMLLGLPDDAERLFVWLNVEYTRRRFPIPAETYEYWAAAVQNPRNEDTR